MKRIFVAACVLAAGVTAWADTLKLKNGGTLEGVVLRESDAGVVVRLKYATVTIEKSEIESIEKKAEAATPAAKGLRLSRWDACIDSLGARPWAGDLRQIPATVIDKGVLKNVPYMSHKAGNYEFNLYGDPDSPACLEVGVYKDLLKSEDAKKACLDLMVSLLPEAKDQEVVRGLARAQDKKERDGLTFEVTPETAEDAYGGWWISVYDVKALDAARATEEELKRITQDEDEIEKEELLAEAERKLAAKKPDPKELRVLNQPPPRTYQETVYLWKKPQVQQARPVRKQGIRRVYIRGYHRPGGLYSRPGLGGGFRR